MALNDKSACVRATAIESTAQRCKKNPIYSPKIVEQSQITAFDKSTNVRRATAFAISVINDKATIPLLINLLKDPNGDVRNWAAFAININKYDNSDIRDCFVEMLQDKNEEVRIEAIIGLSYRKDKRVFLGTITGGMTSTPGLAAADSMVDSNIPSVAYATVYPIAMVFLILFIQVISSAVY